VQQCDTQTWRTDTVRRISMNFNVPHYAV